MASYQVNTTGTGTQTLQLAVYSSEPSLHLLQSQQNDQTAFYLLGAHKLHFPFLRLSARLTTGLPHGLLIPLQEVKAIYCHKPEY